jgi:hypothetical protein
MVLVVSGLGECAAAGQGMRGVLAPEQPGLEDCLPFRGKPCRVLRYRGRFVPQGYAPASLSDVIRVDLLRRYGGIWADATTYCLRPLNDWIYPAIATGFFAFDRPTDDRMVSSWFLAAQRNSYIVDALFRRIRSYWNERSGEPRAYPVVPGTSTYSGCPVSEA